MKLSTRSRYGTRMMLDLAQHNGEGPVQLNDISKRQEISMKYLEQLSIPLKRAGLIDSIRGRKGGYVLKRQPGEISVGSIVKVLEHDSSLARCLEDETQCERSEHCPTRGMWEEATKAVYEKLDGVTLEDLMRRKTT